MTYPAFSALSAAPHPVEARIAVIADHALLLYLPATRSPEGETHSVWRFDLDGLAGHGFRLTGRDGYYDLELCDLDGNDRLLARFVDKHEALQSLQLIHSALQRTDVAPPMLATCPLPIAAAAQAGEKPDCRWRGGCRRMFGWLTFWRVVFLLALAGLLYYTLRPDISLFGDTTPAPLAAPAGVPVDADQVLSE